MAIFMDTYVVETYFRLSVNSVEVDWTAAYIRGSIKMTTGIQAGRK